ncbi:MAG: isoprenyl transferase [Bacteroidales bacterium]
MDLKQRIDLEKLPRHVAVIMDGNGRWARLQGKERIFGHEHGVTSVRETIQAAAEIGISYLTLYAFSTENWYRPKQEVETLMHLLVDAIRNETPELNEKGVRLGAIGNLDALPEGCREELQQAIELTSHNNGLLVNLALSYSSRWEIENAVKQIGHQIQQGVLNPEDIDATLIESFLQTRDIPDPDLLIRTSGELRISNFLLWQIAYSELYFTPVLWPDFRKKHFFQAIIDYQRRERRFGKTVEQVS